MCVVPSLLPSTQQPCKAGQTQRLPAQPSSPSLSSSSSPFRFSALMMVGRGTCSPCSRVGRAGRETTSLFSFLLNETEETAVCAWTAEGGPED